MKSIQDFSTKEQWLEYQRQEFAARAMQGLMSRQIPPDWNKKETKLAWVEWVAELSCEMADELIVQLEKSKS